MLATGVVAEGDDQVAVLDAGSRGGGAGLDADNQDRGGFGEFVEPHQACVDGDVLAGDADVGAVDFAIADEAAGDKFGGFAGDGEAETLGGEDYGGVDADDLAVAVDQGSAGVAGV